MLCGHPQAPQVHPRAPNNQLEPAGARLPAKPSFPLFRPPLLGLVLQQGAETAGLQRPGGLAILGSPLLSCPRPASSHNVVTNSQLVPHRPPSTSTSQAAESPIYPKFSLPNIRVGSAVACLRGQDTGSPGLPEPSSQNANNQAADELACSLASSSSPAQSKRSPVNPPLSHTAHTPVHRLVTCQPLFARLAYPLRLAPSATLHR